jgi:hypothetical protein
MLHQALKRYVFRAFHSLGAAVALGFQLRVVGSAEISVGVPTHTEVRPKHRHIKLSFFLRGERALSTSWWSSPISGYRTSFVFPIVGL